MPFFQKGAKGRDHIADGFTCWMTGAGVKPSVSHGRTDDHGQRPLHRRLFSGFRVSRGQRAVRVIHVFSRYGVVPRAAFFCTPLLANCAQTRESSRVCDACRLVLS
ncbi:MAG: DUF1501 domain-containing protein [Proteobacteria bacterium]|nr:DUF1501 domain-containing protein [Pseudomonadota bacterium]